MAKRAARVQPQATQDLGYPINWMAQGRMGDLVKPLQGLYGMLELQKMVDRDETIGAMMFIINMVMAQVEFGHIACKNGQPIADNQKADDARDFADTLLIDMANDWHEHLEEAMTMVWAGYAPCEITLRQRTYDNESLFNDGYYGVKSIDLRDQTSIGQWVYDPTTRELIGVRQVAMTAEFIPAWKLCNYTTSSVLKRPTGRSLIANAHRVWKLKTKIQDAEAIGIERDLAGLPTFRIPGFLIDQASEKDTNGDATPAALQAQSKIQASIDAVTKMRFNEAGGLVMPSDPWSAADDDINSNLPQYDFKITTTAGQRSIDPRTAARDHDRAMARVVAMQFMHLGDRSSGSYGLSDDQSEMFIRAIMALAHKVCRTYSRTVLRLVWTTNGMDPQYLPTLKPKPFSKEALNSVGIYLQGVSRIMAMIEKDPKARVEALARAGITADPKLQDGPLVPDPTDTGGQDPAADPSNPAPKR